MRWMRTILGMATWCLECSDDPFSLQSEDESDKEKDAEALKELVKEDSEEEEEEEVDDNESGIGCDGKW